MALTRKFLAAMGIESDKIDEIITAHTDTIEGLKRERDAFKEQANSVDSLTAERDALKAEIDGYKKDGSFKEKYEATKAEYEKYKADMTAKETRTAKETAYRSLLKDAGVSDKRIGAVMKVTDIDSIELDEDGKCKDYEALSENVKAEWSDFITTKETKGAKVANPPKNDGKGNTYTSKEEIMAIKDSVERQKAIMENPSLFGY